MRAISIDSDSPRLAEHQAIIRQIKRMGFTGSFVSDGPIPDRSVQVRNLAHLAPRFKVALYKECLLRGDMFPPVITTRDRYMVDGNTRGAANRAAGRKVIAQFRLDVDYEGAPDQVVKKLRRLGAAMNDLNGEGMAQADIRDLIAMDWEPGDDPKVIAADLHYPLTSVKRIFKMQEGRRWLARLGVEDPDGRLSGEHLRHFGNWTEKMTDVVLATTAALARDAKLTAPQTGVLGQKVVVLTSEPAKLDFLDEERLRNKPRIEGITTRDSQPEQLRKLLESICGFTPNPKVAAETDEDASLRERTRNLLKEAQYVIGEVIKEQFEVDNNLDNKGAPRVPFFKSSGR